MLKMLHGYGRRAQSSRSDHVHWSLHRNESISGTHVYLNMLINVPFTLVPLCSKEIHTYFFVSGCENCEGSTKYFNFQCAPPPWVGSRVHMVHTLASGSILKPPENPFCIRSTVGQTSRNCVSFKLQLHDSNPMIFCENHFQHPNVLFYHESVFSSGRFTT